MYRIILADNEIIFRAGVARVFAMEPDFEVVAQVAEADAVLRSIQGFRGATVLLATGLKLDLRVISAMLRECGSRGLLITDKRDGSIDLTGLALGGMVPRSITAKDLVDCVRRVSQGQPLRALLSPSAQTEDGVGARVLNRLTQKEMQIVALIVEGCKNKQIALRLGTKEQVIKNYLRSIYDKTGVSDRLELALFTLHHRLLAEAAAKAGSLIAKRMA